MEEPKRLQFTTIGPSNREKKKATVSQTIRINLNLNEANDETCQEFSYVELLKNAVGEKPADEKADGVVGEEPDPFGDYKEDDKLAAIAKKFEEKYAPKPGKGKRRTRIQDLVDLGEGYDESDNFIDNSEAYDEIVPACLTTKLGGFYINAGVLDFREVSDDSADEFSLNVSGLKKRKNMITSDSEGSEEEVRVKKKRGPKPKKKFPEGFAAKKRKRLSAEGDKLFKRPRKPIDKWKRKKRSPTVSELLKQQSVTTTVNGVDSSEGNGSSLQNGTNIDSAIESVVSRVLLDEANGQSEERVWQDNLESVPALPAGLSQRVLDTITKLKAAAKVSREGKCRFFTHEVNRMVLLVELETQQLSCGTRQIVYTHLAAYLPCSKETLLKRAKKLRLNENDDKLKEPIQRLRDAINATMPAQLEKHAQECRLAAQVRLLEGKGKEEVIKEEASTESDDENGVEKKRYSPRRKFEWSPTIRQLLCEIVRIKMRTYDLSKLRAQSAEEYLKLFLESEIKPIWPKGWIQTRMLYKESKIAHEPWTNSQRPKKPVIVTKAADCGTKLTSAPQGHHYEADGNYGAAAAPSVSSTDDEVKRVLKTGHAAVLEQMKPQVSSSKKPTLLDYADRSSAAGDSTVTSSKVSADSSERPGNKTSVAEATSSSGRCKPPDADTHNIAMEILKSMRQLPQAPSQSGGLPGKSSPRDAHSSFMAQFQKYASAGVSLEDSALTTSPRILHEIQAAAQTQLALQNAMAKAAQSAQSAPQKQVSPPGGHSVPQDKGHHPERKQSPFTLLHQQLEQQQKLKQQQETAGGQKDAGKRESSATRPQQRSPQVSPSGGEKEGRQSSDTYILNQQMQQHLQQNYLNLMHKTHGVGQSKPPQPPNMVQAKRQSLLAAAISSVPDTTANLSVASVASVRPSHHPVSSSSAVSNSLDRPGTKAARVSHTSAPQNQSLHSQSLLSLKRKLSADGHGGTPVAPSAQQKRSHPAPSTMPSPTSLPNRAANWNLMSFVNPSSNPPVAHSAVGGVPNNSPFSPPVAHSQPSAVSRSSPAFPGRVVAKKISPTSHPHPQARSPDAGRAVVSSSVPYSQGQLSPRGGLSPHGSPLGGMYPSMHSPGHQRSAPSPHNSSRSPHGY